MKALPLNRKVLVNRLKEFTGGHHFAIAEHHLRRALEAIFDAGNHILSRFPLAPSQRPETYKAIALAMGRYKVVSEEFAKGPLSEMAGYRNRLIHFYDEISPSELHGIIRDDLKDIEAAAKALRDVISHPKRIGLEIS